MENRIHKAIKSHFGFDVPILIKTNKELQVIFDDSPFSNEKKESSYFIILNKGPEKTLLKEVLDIPYENEEVVIKGDALYFYCAAGYGQTKFNMNTYERKLKISGTSRNYKTMVKLLSLSEAIK